jgi:hypothetical protein
MTLIHPIHLGPSKWDLILSLFEKKPIKFTLEGGRVIELIADAVVESGNADGIAPFEMYPGECWTACDYLLSGAITNGPALSYCEYAFIEYGLSPRFGVCAILSEDEFDKISELAYLPNVWRQVIGQPII